MGPSSRGHSGLRLPSRPPSPRHAALLCLDTGERGREEPPWSEGDAGLEVRSMLAWGGGCVPCTSLHTCCERKDRFCHSSDIHTFSWFRSLSSLFWMQSSFLLRQRCAAMRFLLRRRMSWMNSSCSEVSLCILMRIWKSLRGRDSPDVEPECGDVEKSNWGRLKGELPLPASSGYEKEDRELDVWVWGSEGGGSALMY
ncbi:hypothetical protein F7725_007555 [Dissostichus mawsoni]|uniref:Uncharacterized protein n=1 Tax=Dissostichus mawsoni TaxID=36200 RepID=A0A7J5Y4R7_DISMA|nr:hypothetical protein F7725_007555 [Dissostichus mawsoni]